MTTRYEARFHLIEPDRRIVCAYNLHYASRFDSVTLSSVELAPQSDHTQLSYTEQIVFLDGHDGTADRRHTLEQQLATLQSLLGLTAAA